MPRTNTACPIYANLLLVAIALAFVLALVLYRQRGPLLITLGLFAAMPLYSGLSHWFDSDQRNHWFGYWFGHDMFTPPFKGADGKPLYPEMTKDAVLFGGTDPGRFCPTYMIFCESFTPHDCQPPEDQNFDRRDVYIITQNALADGTYLYYIRAHYNRSTQIDPPFFRNCSGRRSRTRITRRTCWPGRWRRWTGSLRRWAPGWKSAGAPTPRGLPTRTLSTCPPLRPSCAPARSRTRSRSTSMRTSARRPSSCFRPRATRPRLRRSLAEDLNRLLERELKIKQRLKAKKQEKDAVDQEIADGSTSERLRQKQEQLGYRDRRAVQDRPALRAGAVQAGAALGIPGRFHQGKPAELDPHPAEPAAAGSGLPEGNRPEPGRGLPGPRNLHRHA